MQHASKVQSEDTCTGGKNVSILMNICGYSELYNSINVQRQEQKGVESGGKVVLEITTAVVSTTRTFPSEVVLSVSFKRQSHFLILHGHNLHDLSGSSDDMEMQTYCTTGIFISKLSS